MGSVSPIERIKTQNRMQCTQGTEKTNISEACLLDVMAYAQQNSDESFERHRISATIVTGAIQYRVLTSENENLLPVVKPSGWPEFPAISQQLGKVSLSTHDWVIVTP